MYGYWVLIKDIFDFKDYLILILMILLGLGVYQGKISHRLGIISLIVLLFAILHKLVWYKREIDYHTDEENQ